MYPELNLDLARYHMAERLRRAERRALVGRLLDDGRARPRRRGPRLRRRADEARP